MTSSDNMVAKFEPWRLSSSSSWMSEYFARDTEILTKALQNSIANNTNGVVVSCHDDLVRLAETTTSSHHQKMSFTSLGGEYFAHDTETLTKALQNSMANNNNGVVSTTSSPHQTQSLTSSGGGGGSETETVSKRTTTSFRNVVPVVKGKGSTKRKSRASKRSPTTFITADPENFRQMVQQVTGIRFSGGPGPVGSVVKPEPQRPVGCGGVVNRVQTGFLLPTLDTSAFLLDHHQEQQVMGSGPGPSPVEFGLAGVVGEVGGPGFDFDGFAGFPTLESWN